MNNYVLSLLYRPVSLVLLSQNKEKLLNFAKLTPQDIKDLWKLKEDKDIDINDIEYSYNIPLYAKMVMRYKNSQNSPVKLFHQIDPHNQNKLSMKYDIDKSLLQFFSWIELSWGIIDIAELEKVEIEESTYVDKFSKSSIDFFFFINDLDKSKVIKEYNESCENWNVSLLESVLGSLHKSEDSEDSDND